MVALVSNAKVAPSESWTLIWVIENCVFGICESHFFPEFELEEERTPRIVSNLTIDTAPFERGVGGDGSAELSADDGHCVADTVAALMELRRRKVVLRRTEEELQLRTVELFQQKGVFL